MGRKQRIDELLLAEIRDRRNREPGQDVLSLLLAARDENGEAMTDGELRDELMTMLFAGHETTASMLAWAFYWIHANPEVKERLLNEIQEYGSHEFLPFGGSNRRCLGYAFAQFEIKVVLATILSRIKVGVGQRSPRLSRPSRHHDAPCFRCAHEANRLASNPMDCH